MSNAFKGIMPAPTRRAMAKQGERRKRHERSDAERRARMGELDDATPYKPSRSDLVVGSAAQAELARIEKARR